MGSSGGLTRVRHTHSQRYPFLSVCVVVSCVQTMVWLPVFGICNVRIYVGACDFSRGLYRHCKSLHWKLTLGEKSLAALGTRSDISIVPGFSVGCSTNGANHCFCNWYLVFTECMALRIWKFLFGVSPSFTPLVYALACLVEKTRWSLFRFFTCNVIINCIVRIGWSVRVTGGLEPSVLICVCHVYFISVHWF